MPVSLIYVTGILRGYLSMSKNTKDVLVWGNQHGHGIILTGKSMRTITHLAKIMGVSPNQAFNEAMKQAITNWELNNMDFPQCYKDV